MWSDRALTIKVRNKLMELIASRQYDYSCDKRRLVPNFQNRLDSPWAFFGCGVNARNCHLWTKIMFRHFDLVPAYCRFNCHKVVAKPASVADLIRLYHFANAIPFFAETLTIPIGKAGIDTRSYTDNAYACFWYANNLAHAKNLHRMIQPLLAENGMEDIAETLIVKKACTEMEAQFGPTDGDFWKSMSADERLLEDRISDIFLVEPDDATPQPNWHINGIIENWLDHARAHGDLSGDERYGLNAFKSVTYHQKEE